MLQIENLNVWFGRKRDRVDAVKAATFHVAQGESFGLVGESGSGKSTILRAVTGLAPTWSGGIKIQGTQVAHKRPRAFFKQVQMVFQDPYASLHPRHSVDQVLGETLYLHGFQDIDARVVQLLDDVGLGQKFRFRYPHQLSGGQRQRVAIARALAPQPELLLLDEPTSALDVSVQAEILNLLADLRQAQNLTYVMVSHDLSVVGHMCDRLAVMKDGEIIEIMDVAALQNMQATHPYAQHLLQASV
ncbi:MAG: ABC transporter ATP-binding protein [Paracoccaceae bacterium]